MRFVVHHDVRRVIGVHVRESHIRNAADVVDVHRDVRVTGDETEARQQRPSARAGSDE